MYVCMYSCMNACMHACMYVCMDACIHACMHAGTNPSASKVIRWSIVPERGEVGEGGIALHQGKRFLKNRGEMNASGDDLKQNMSKHWVLIWS